MTYASPEYTRDARYIATRITADGADGYAVEAGRYRLVAARACPWANRALIVRRLLGLEDAISLGLSRVFSDDHEMLRHGLVMYDALFAWCREGQAETHNWPPQMTL